MKNLLFSNFVEYGVIEIPEAASLDTFLPLKDIRLDVFLNKNKTGAGTVKVNIAIQNVWNVKLALCYTTSKTFFRFSLAFCSIRYSEKNIELNNVSKFCLILTLS